LSRASRGFQRRYRLHFLGKGALGVPEIMRLLHA
jgi:hypothetical protein